jgi:hypothetical protein
MFLSDDTQRMAEIEYCRFPGRGPYLYLVPKEKRAAFGDGKTWQAGRQQKRTQIPCLKNCAWNRWL